VKPKMLLILNLLLVLVLSAQSQQTAKQTDPQATETLQKSINAMGGSAALAAVTDATASGTVVTNLTSSQRAGIFLWEDLLSGQENAFRRETDYQGSNPNVVSSRAGHVWMQSSGAPAYASPQFAIANPPLYLPSVMLAREVGDPTCLIRMVDSKLINGVSATGVSVECNKDPISRSVSPQKWYFDPSSGLPLALEHRLPSSQTPDRFKVSTTLFSNFHVVQGLMIPFQLQLTLTDAKGPSTLYQISSVTFNRGLAGQLFEIPAGGGL
jgi:hypothetical protein